MQRAASRVALFGTMLTTAMILGIGAANATVDPVDAAFTDMQGKVTTYGAAIVALVVLAAGIFLGVKYLKKGLSKA